MNGQKRERERENEKECEKERERRCLCINEIHNVSRFGIECDSVVLAQGRNVMVMMT